MIRVGFNATTLDETRMTGGINRHILGLLSGLRAGDCEVHLFSDRPMTAAPDWCRPHRSDVRPRLLWEQATLPLEARGARVDVFHSHINYGLPRLAPGFARVLTLHDLYTLRDLRRMSPLEPGWLSLTLSWKACASADAVITVSEYSRGEILKEFPAWEEKVHVVHNGVERRFSPGKPSSPAYALYVGSFGPRKNVAVLAEALKAMKKKLILKLTGDPSLAPAFDGLPGVEWLGYVQDEDLPALYRGAGCVVVPSMEEGFGFQVIEAMASGVPVFCSRAASLPEVGGDAAAYFDPDDPRGLAALLDRAASDEPWRRGFAAAGLARAAGFTWKKAAEKTLAVYEAVRRKG